MAISVASARSRMRAGQSSRTRRSKISAPCRSAPAGTSAGRGGRSRAGSWAWREARRVPSASALLYGAGGRPVRVMAGGRPTRPGQGPRRRGRARGSPAACSRPGSPSAARCGRRPPASRRAVDEQDAQVEVHLLGQVRGGLGEILALGNEDAEVHVLPPLRSGILGRRGSGRRSPCRTRARTGARRWTSGAGCPCFGPCWRRRARPTLAPSGDRAGARCRAAGARCGTRWSCGGRGALPRRSPAAGRPRSGSFIPIPAPCHSGSVTSRQARASRAVTLPTGRLRLETPRCTTGSPSTNPT